MLKKIRNEKSLRNKVFGAIRDYVISDELAPGSKIDEAFLAKQLGVSKTPIREALSILATEGIIHIIPNRGSFKVILTKKDINDIMLIRETLEGLCIQLAAKKMKDKTIEKLEALLNDFENIHLKKAYSSYIEVNVKFYELVYKSADCPRLVSLIQSTKDLTQMLRVKYFRDPSNVKNSLKLHRELIAAIKERNEVLAREIRLRMIQKGYQIQLAML